MSCLVCGAPVDDSAHLPDWLGKFRAIYFTPGEWDRGRISGIARRQGLEWLIPLDPSVRAVVSQGVVSHDWVSIRLMNYSWEQCLWTALDQQPLWGYTFHDSCWTIFTMNKGETLDDDALLALSYLCLSRSLHLGVMDWGHEYEGLLNRDDDERPPGQYPILLPKSLNGNEYLSDPYDQSFISNLLAPDQNKSEQKQAIDLQRLRSSRKVADPFGWLPTEILTTILTALESTDVANVRLASRFVADVRLPDIFWRSRFWSGREFDFLSDAIKLAASGTTTVGQWKFIFDRANSVKSRPSMVNRRRIWTLASRLRSLIELRLAAQLCHGTFYHCFHNPVVENPKRWCSTSQPYLSLPWGCRSLWEVVVALEGSLASVWVSLVKLNSRSYIAGLRFDEKGGSNSVTFGYQRAGSIHKSLIGPLLGFQVAIDEDGVRGLRFITTYSTSDWVGEHQDIPQTIITCTDVDNQSRQRIQSIKGGFDVRPLMRNRRGI